MRSPRLWFWVANINWLLVVLLICVRVFAPAYLVIGTTLFAGAVAIMAALLFWDISAWEREEEER